MKIGFNLLLWTPHVTAKHRTLLTDIKKAGYDGSPIRILTSRQYEFHYKMAQVAAEYLKAAGLKVDLQVVDWATLVKRRNNPKEYEAFTTGTGNIFDPASYTVLSCTWPGWTCDEDIQKLNQELARETDYKKRFALWEQMHQLFYEKVVDKALAFTELMETQA